MTALQNLVFDQARVGVLRRSGRPRRNIRLFISKCRFMYMSNSLDARSTCFLNPVF